MMLGEGLVGDPRLAFLAFKTFTCVTNFVNASLNEKGAFILAPASWSFS